MHAAGQVRCRMLKRIYNALLKEYGFQGWWPVTPRGGSVPRYRGGPTNRAQVIEVMLGAVLTQNTSWKNAERAVSSLKQKELIQPEKLLAISLERLADIIRPSGYFNQKAKKLRALALFLREHPLRVLAKMKVAPLRDLLLKINGVGPETADSILLYALQKPIFVVDAYTRRIFTRLGFIPQDAGYDQIQRSFHSELPRSAALFNEYHALIVEHGKNVCRKKPNCNACCLSRLCAKIGVTLQFT